MEEHWLLTCSPQLAQLVSYTPQCHLPRHGTSHINHQLTKWPKDLPTGQSSEDWTSIKVALPRVIPACVKLTRKLILSPFSLHFLFPFFPHHGPQHMGQCCPYSVVVSQLRRSLLEIPSPVSQVILNPVKLMVRTNHQRGGTSIQSSFSIPGEWFPGPSVPMDTKLCSFAGSLYEITQCLHMTYTHHPVFLKPPLDFLYLVQYKHHWQQSFCIDIFNHKLVKSMGVEPLDTEVWLCLGKFPPMPSQ